MNKKKYLFLVLHLVIAQVAWSQSKESTNNDYYQFRHEVGVNVTSLLGNLLSLTNNEAAPYGFYYAKHYKKNVLRVGFNIYTDSKSISDPLGEKILRDQNYGVRLSYDRNLQLNKRFMMHGGFDVIGKYLSSYSTTGNFFSNSIENISAGGGPAMRIVFKLHERIYLMTESTLYGEYGNKIQTTVLNLQKDKSTHDFYSFKLTMPTSLYISIHF